MATENRFSGRIPIVVDSEIGDNIDDAFSLALAAVSPEIELLGVTTTFYQADLRSIIARRLLGAYGMLQVPVSAGRNPRYTTGTCSNFTQGELAKPTHLMSPDSGLSALDWLAGVLSRRCDVTYVANAPLTNLADLLRCYPDLASSISAVVLMGGWPSQALPEWNIMQDPESASVVFQSGLPLITVGYEVTLRCHLLEEQALLLRQSPHPGPRFLGECARLFMASTTTGSADMIMHDPLTVALLCNRTLAKLEENRLELQENRGPGFGALHMGNQRGITAMVATDVDKRRYMDFLLRRVALEDPQDATINQSADGLNPVTALSTEVVDALHIYYYPGWHLDSAVSRCYVMAYVSEGEVVFSSSACENRMVETGGLFLIAPGCPYTLSAESGVHLELIRFEACSVSHGLTEPSGQALPYLQTTATCLPQDESEYIKKRMCQLVKMQQRPDYKNSLLCHSVLLDVLAQFVSITMGQVTSDISGRDLVNKALSALETNIEGWPSLNDLSTDLGVSRGHLVRLFQRHLGMSPIRYHHLLKLRQARSLLQLGHQTVAEVAANLGYSSVQAFSRAFKSHTGENPAAFRSRNSDTI